MIVNRAAALNVPRDMPAFFGTAVMRLMYLGPEPDRWKGDGHQLSSTEAPEHYLNYEMLKDVGDLPSTRYQFYQRLAETKAKEDAAGTKPPGGEELIPEKVGTQPYAAIETYQRLLGAFRDYRHLKAAGQPTAAVEQDAVLYAGWLGHYVGDAAQPLHTTVNYNGWVLANPNGYTTDRHTHAKFEGEFVQKNLKQFDVTRMLHAPTKLERPFEDYLQLIRDSNAQVEKLYQLEKLKAFDGDGTPEGVDFVRVRLAAGAQMLLNMWYTAWVNSGVDDPRYRMPMTSLPQAAATPRTSRVKPAAARP